MLWGFVWGGGKSGGYRIYFLADRKNQRITILAFYPKTGKFGKSDLSRDEERACFELYKKEKDNDALVVHDISNKFEFQKSWDKLN